MKFLINRFATDFNIFPDYLSKSRLNSFFEGIIIYKNDGINIHKNKDIVIDFSHFVDILALCAFDITFPEPEPSVVEKVFYILIYLDVVFY